MTFILNTIRIIIRASVDIIIDSHRMDIIDSHRTDIIDSHHTDIIDSHHTDIIDSPRTDIIKLLRHTEYIRLCCSDYNFHFILFLYKLTKMRKLS